MRRSRSRTSTSPAPLRVPAPPPSTTRSCRSSSPARSSIKAYGRGAFMGQVHTDSAVRDAGNEAEERINKWRVAARLPRRPVPTPFAPSPTPTRRRPSRASAPGCWSTGCATSGAPATSSAPDERAELERLRNRLVELEVAFQRNINEYQRRDRGHARAARRPARRLRRAPLAGRAGGHVPGQPRLPRGEPVPGAGAGSRPAPRAVPQELDQGGRRQPAAPRRGARPASPDRRVLLGHPTWAHYAMELKMARTPERVADFYEELVPPLAGAGPDASWIALAEGLARGRPRRTDHRLGLALLRRRAAAQRVRRRPEPGQRVLPARAGARGHVRDHRRGASGSSTAASPDAGAWHERAAVRDPRHGVRGELIAHFYADLFPREGKFGHAAAFPLVVGHRSARRQLRHAGERHRRQLHAAVGRHAGAAQAQRGRRRSSTSSGTSCT